jgi:Holliday junction resolvase
MNSKRKGAAGERQFRDKIREFGFDCRRGRQFSGSPESPDVVSEDLSRYHFEVKLRESTSFYAWMRQSARDAGTKIPIVAHRANRGEWHIFIKADHFFDILKCNQPES